MAGAGPLEGDAQLVQLPVASDEAGQPAGRGDLQTRPRRRETGKLEHFHGLAEPLDGHGAERFHPDVPLDEAEGGGRQQDRIRLRHLLHPGREVGGLAHRGVVHVEVATDRPHQHVAGIQADPDLDGNAMRTLHLVAVAAHPLLHAEGRVAGAERVIFVGERGAEESHDAVAHDLVDGAFVVVDGLHHALQDGVEQVARLLGVALGEQLHGALEVGEENGHLLALAFQRAAGSQDAGGEVLRRVRLRRDARRRCRGAQRLTTLIAEATTRGVARPARRARHREAGAAVAAEPGRGRIGLPAARAEHRTERCSAPL